MNEKYSVNPQPIEKTLFVREIITGSKAITAAKIKPHLTFFKKIEPRQKAKIIKMMPFVGKNSNSSAFKPKI